MEQRFKALFILTITFIVLSAISPVLAGGTGNGVLYVYDMSMNIVPLDSNGYYLVDIGSQYHFVVQGITEFNPGDTVRVRIGWPGVTATIINTVVLSDGSVDVVCPVPSDATVCETGTVQYGVEGNYFLAREGVFSTKPGHFHVIPENYLGPLGVLGVGALAMVAFATIKRHSIRIPFTKFH